MDQSGTRSSQHSHSRVSSLNSSCRLSWWSDVAVKEGRQPGFSRPQIRIITSSSLSSAREAPSRMKPSPGRTREPWGEGDHERPLEDTRDH